MNNLFIGGTAAMALATPASAGEFQFNGAEFTLTGTYSQFTANNINPTLFDWKTATLGGSFEFGLGDGALTQIDTSVQGIMPFFQNGNRIGLGFGTHLGYEFGPEASVGVFAGLDTWHGVWGTYTLGAEVAGEVDRFFYEAYGAYNSVLPIPATPTDSSLHADAMAGYRITDAFSLGVGGHYGVISGANQTYYGQLVDGDTIWQAKVEARYDFTDDLAVAAGYTYSNPTYAGEAHSVTLSLSKKLGKGTTFKQRNYINLFNGFNLY